MCALVFVPWSKLPSTTAKCEPRLILTRVVVIPLHVFMVLVQFSCFELTFSLLCLEFTLYCDKGIPTCQIHCI
uniref:Uncharacterized protein n=1 Tax=Arundo donax TaxID=35708 RepID=A0A0A8ZI49_ARUDO